MSDRIKGGLIALIRSVFSRIDYLAFYRAKVVTQSADKLNVDVQPDDARIPGLSGVPLMLGLPSAKVDITVGCYVLVGWKNGDPRFPFAMLWESGASTIQLNLNANTLVLNNGSLKVARDTDPVNAGSLAGTAGPWPVNFTHVDSKTLAVTAGPTVNLTGKITDGVGTVKA